MTATAKPSSRVHVSSKNIQITFMHFCRCSCVSSMDAAMDCQNAASGRPCSRCVCNKDSTSLMLYPYKLQMPASAAQLATS